MSFQNVKGTRDFYPEPMRLRNWILDAWRRVSLRNGFEEYDAPIFEYLDLLTAKSGEEIASQLFSFTDRGGRSLAIRPEITPSLARMVNARVGSLPRPIKWFSMPRLCRAENPQRGRLREFFQWNIDIIGADDVLADAECIFVAVDLLAELGLGPQDVSVRIGSRSLTTALLLSIGVGEAEVDKVLPVLDKRAKISDEAFVELAAKAGLDAGQMDAVRRFQDCSDVDQLAGLLGDGPAVTVEVDKLRELLAALRALGVADYCRLDMRIVRGLAYYTGIVYEIFSEAPALRALAGGGRYDNLLEVLGGPKLGATGFGMGDVVLGILLEEKGKLPAGLCEGRLDYFVIDAAEGLVDETLSLVAELRRRGFSTDFNYRRQPLGKQLKVADRRSARFAVLVGPDGLDIKDLASGEQVRRSRQDFLTGLGRKD